MSYTHELYVGRLTRYGVRYSYALEIVPGAKSVRATITVADPEDGEIVEKLERSFFVDASSSAIRRDMVYMAGR